MTMNELQLLKEKLKRRYKNGPDNIGRDFVGPCLKQTVLYRRGTGFFSSGALQSYASAMEHLISGNVKIEIICSPIIQDVELIKILENNQTQEQREETIQNLTNVIILNAIEFSQDNSRRSYKGALLAYLIASGILEIKFAIPYDIVEMQKWNIESITDNLYHVKTGYFKLIDGSIVAFEGSFNESDSGHQHHIEHTQVWRSWHHEDVERMTDVVSDIDEDWKGENKYLKIYNIGSEVLEIIKKCAPEIRPIKVENNNSDNEENKSSLRNYQNEALIAWSKNNHQGILALATGTGKTKTSIVAIRGFLKKFKNGLVIVTAPYVPLAKQWVKELNGQNISTINVFDNRDNWLSRVQNFIQLHNTPTSETKIPVLVCVNKTFRSDLFQGILARLEGDGNNKMIIVDECHHFNRAAQIDYLPTKFQCRMGLSATPYEPDEPEILSRYFGDIVYKYSIKQAISEGYLAPYEYHPIFVEFTVEEAEKYIETIKSMQRTTEIKKIYNGEDELESIPINEIDRLLETIAGKLTKLEEILIDTGVMPLTLFYCGEGFVEIDQIKTRQIDTLTRVLFQLGWKVGKITSSESANDRENTLTNFKNKTIDAVASMRVLDEGIDVPDCAQAFVMASQRLVRQGVQRRGRILRKSENKKFAKLFDFIITGPKLSDRELDKLYTRELQRAKMFSDDALNKNECFDLLSQF
jgi:superfamily II DNA or RNA helicase